MVHQKKQMIKISPKSAQNASFVQNQIIRVSVVDGYIQQLYAHLLLKNWLPNSTDNRKVAECSQTMQANYGCNAQSAVYGCNAQSAVHAIRSILPAMTCR